MRAGIIQQQQHGTLVEEYPIWTPGRFISAEEIYDFIVRSSEVRGMYFPDVRTVIDNEGGWQVPTLRNYAGEPAWGPLQLHVVAEDTRPGFEQARAIAISNPCLGYVGDQFICVTGFHPSDPRAYKLALEFGLNYAIKAGTWAAWYGAKFLPDGRFTAVQGTVQPFSKEAKMFAGWVD